MITAILTSLFALMIVAFLLQDKENRKLTAKLVERDSLQDKENRKLTAKLVERDSLLVEWENRDNYLLAVIDQWEAYAASLESRNADLRLHNRIASQPQYTVYENGHKVSAQPLPGMGFDGKKYQASFDSEGHIIAVEKPSKPTTSKPSESTPIVADSSKPSKAKVSKVESKLDKADTSASDTVIITHEVEKLLGSKLESHEVSKLVGWHTGKGKASAADYVKRIQGMRKSK